MKIISNSHVDDHSALLALVASALPKVESRIVAAQAMREEVTRMRSEFAALPWYKRMFSLAEPCYDHANMHLHFAKQNLELLEKIKRRAQYELTIELSDKEANIVFGDYT